MRKFTIVLMCFIVLISCSNNKNDNKAKEFNSIVAAGGSITEILYFLELENKIKAVDVTSVYPREALKKPKIGYVRNLSAEGILSLDPDLVIGEDDMGPPNVISQLKKLNVNLKIVEEIQTPEGILEKIYTVAKILNIEQKAKQIVNNKLIPSVKELKKLSKENSTLEKNKVILILSMEGTSPVIAGANTGGDSFIQMIGARNVYSQIEGWKTVSIESILEYNPDYIILPQRDVHKNSNIDLFKKNPAISKTKASLNDNFIIDDSMAILGFGPRTIFSALDAAKKINEGI